MTPTTIFIIEKVLQVYNWDNKINKYKIYSSSLLHILNDKGKKSDTYIFISCLLHFLNI